MMKWLIIIFICGCQPAMKWQPRHNVYDRSSFYRDESSDRLPLADTYTYKQVQNGPINESVVVDRNYLLRGKERYEIFCMVCHGMIGEGDGIVTRRGFSHPVSFHSETLRKANDTYYLDVIRHGIRKMARLGDRIAPRDQLAIVSYIRVLQFSQNMHFSDLSPKDKAIMENQK